MLDYENPTVFEIFVFECC